MSNNSDRILNDSKRVAQKTGKAASTILRKVTNLIPPHFKLMFIIFCAVILLVSILVGGTGGIYSVENTHIYADGTSDYPMLSDMSKEEMRKDNEKRDDAIEAMSKYTTIIHEQVQENHDEVDKRINAEIQSKGWDADETKSRIDDQTGYEEEGTPITSSKSSSSSTADLTEGEKVVEGARKYIGPTYLLGGKKLKNLKIPGDKNSIDCSSFTRAIYKKYGHKKLQPLAWDQRKDGKIIGSGKKDLKKAQPGDLLIYHGDGHDHVAIFCGKIKGRYYQIHSTDKDGQHDYKGVMETDISVKWARSPKYIVRVFGGTKGTVETKSKHGKCWAALKLAGYSDEAAAGIMGNIEQESNFNASYYVTSGPWAGTGLFNMTDGNSDRLISYAEKKNKNWKNSPSIQIEWMDRKHVPGCFKSYTGKSNLYYYSDWGTYTWWHKKVSAGEFKKINPSNWKKYKQEDDGQGTDKNAVDLCTHMWCNVIERAGKPNMNRRRECARKWYKKYAGKMATEFEDDVTYDVTVEDLKILSAFSVSLGNLQMSERVKKSEAGYKASGVPQYEFRDEDGKKMDVEINSATGKIDFERTIKKKMEKYRKKVKKGKVKGIPKGETAFFDVTFQTDSSGSTTFTKTVETDLGIGDKEVGDLIKKATTRTIKYGIPIVKNKDINKISMPMFGVDPEAPYVNSKSTKNSDAIDKMTKNAIAIYFEGDPNAVDGKSVLVDGNMQNKYTWPAPGNKKTKYDKKTKILEISGKEGDPVVTIDKGSIAKIKKTKNDTYTVTIEHEKGTVKVTYMNIVINDGIKEKIKVKKNFQFATFPKDGKIRIKVELNNKKVNPKQFIESSDNGNYIWPVPKHKNISSPFGPRGRYNETLKKDFHTGMDIGAPEGARIVASRGGTVVKIYRPGEYGNYGNLTIIKHSGNCYTFYAHQSKVLVKQGERVSQGQTIGKVGHTGGNFASHLHIEIVKGNWKEYSDHNRENPAKYLKKYLKN